MNNKIDNSKEQQKTHRKTNQHIEEKNRNGPKHTEILAERKNKTRKFELEHFQPWTGHFNSNKTDTQSNF